MLKIMGLASVVLLLAVGTAAAIGKTLDKLPVAKNSHFQMLVEEGTSRRSQQEDYDPKTCPTKIVKWKNSNNVPSSSRSRTTTQTEEHRTN